MHLMMMKHLVLCQAIQKQICREPVKTHSQLGQPVSVRSQGVENIERIHSTANTSSGLSQHIQRQVQKSCKWKGV